MSSDYEYGDRRDELSHGARELQQLQICYATGALTEREFEAATERIREKHGIRPWGTFHGP